jgi:hypothetical protein
MFNTLVEIDSYFRSEYDILIRKNENSILKATKDTYVNSKILEWIKNQFVDDEKSKIEDYIELVKEKTKSINKELIFEFVSSTVQAQTINMEQCILISISDNILKEKICEVFLHELGEAEYIANRFAVLMDERKRDEIKFRMIEILTHRFIHQRMKELGFEKYLTKFSEKWSKVNYTNYSEPWVTVMMIIWSLGTYPNLMQLKNSINGYEKYHDIIQKMLTELNDVQLFESQQSTFEKCTKILKLFEEIGTDNFKIEYFS